MMQRVPLKGGDPEPLYADTESMEIPFSDTPIQTTFDAITESRAGAPRFKSVAELMDDLNGSDEGAETTGRTDEDSEKAHPPL